MDASHLTTIQTDLNNCIACYFFWTCMSNAQDLTFQRLINIWDWISKDIQKPLWWIQISKPECKYIVKWLLWLKMIYEIDIKSKRIYNGVCGCQWTQKDHCGRQKFEGHYPNVILIIKYCFTIKEFQWKTEMSALDMTVLQLLYVTSY